MQIRDPAWQNEYIETLVNQLLEEPNIKDNVVVFTPKAVELIHVIAERCRRMPIVEETRQSAEEYAQGLTAGQIYIDMMYKIMQAPTRLHMILSARMLIPVIERKLEAELSSADTQVTK